MRLKIKTAQLPVVLALFTGLEALAATAYLLMLPADPKNVIALGFSAQRLAMLALLILVAAAAFGLAIRMAKNPAVTLRRLEQLLEHQTLVRWLIILAGVAGTAAWLAGMMPQGSYGRFALLMRGLRSAVLLLSLIGFQSALLLVVAQNGFSWAALRVRLKENRGVLLAAGVFLAIFCAAWVLIFGLGLGLSRDQYFWNEPGVPILCLQVVIGVVLACLALALTPQTRVESARRGLWLDLGLALVIWATAAVLWNAQPQQKTYFAPGPYPPDEAYYPFSDASTYDIAAEFAVIGQGLRNHAYVDKPLYSTFLTALHAIVGGNMVDLIRLQVMVLALLPALLFWLGRSLHGRAAGLMLAVLATGKEMNAIAASLLLQLSHTKMLMSEVPTAIGLVAFTILMVRWLKEKNRRPLYAMLAGGSLGLTTLVRHNPWILLPTAFLVALLAFGRPLRRWVISCLLLLAVLAAAILPWSLRSAVVMKDPFYMMRPVINVVWKNRYKVELPKTPAAQATPSPEDADGISTEPATGGDSGLGRMAGFVVTHFFNNVLATSVMLPTATTLENVTDTIRRPGSPWDQDSRGRLSTGAAAVYVFNFLLVALGLGWCWRRWQWAGVMPFITYGAYLFALAVARTSGGRYVVSIDWVLPLYYSIGVVVAICWAAALFNARWQGEAESEVILTTAERVSWRQVGGIALAFLLVGALLPLMDVAFPRRYADLTTAQLLDRVEASGLLQQAGITRAQLETLQQNPDFSIQIGRALYPRFYGAGGGEPDRFSLFREQGYPRLAFYLIGPAGTSGIVLPMKSSPATFPNESDVLVLSCDGKRQRDALAVVRLGETNQIYLRQPAAEWDCPLTPPQCDNNSNCQ